ncbi:MAG: PAS domain S-box protein, partial [Anaerolineae bacterium]|nr:PAS domain S-box protein [Anaerolineae bacterium]
MSTALRLLILEDDPLDAELEVATLEKAGYVCQWERVETRAEFLACLDAPDYDAILVDYNLPAFDGLTALHLYLERDLDLPFIFVSGTMGEETAIESLKAGATDYVLKERLSRLGPVVARALHEREERRQHKRVEEELQKNRRLLNAIVDHSPVAIQIKDLQGHYLLVNKQIETIFDLQRGEAIGRMPYDIFPQEIATKFLADDQDTLKAGTAMQIEEVIPFPDGLHTFIALKFPLADASGEPYAVAGIATDITEQKRAEEALRESEERFRALVQNSPDIIVVMESARSVRYASPAVERILGYSADHFLTNDPFEHVHPDDVQMVQEKLSQAIQNPGTPIRAEFRLKHRDGSWVSIEMITNSLLDKPEVRGIVINARDITKRKRAEEALRENEELLDSILTASAVGIAYTRDRKIIWANDAMAKLFGFTEEEQYVGKDTKMLYASEEEYRRIGEIAYEQRKLGELVEFDAEFRRLDGSPFDGHVKINTLDPLNPMRGIIVSIIDITKRKLTEEALRRNERFLQDVFDAIQDGISVLDTDLNVIQTNRWMEQMYTHHMPLVGQKCYQVYQERHSPCPWCPSLC